MAPRFVFAALILAFGVALVFAAWTTAHHVSTHSSAAIHGSGKRS